MENPFTLAFGKKPLQYIARLSQTEELVEKLNRNNPPSYAYMITGVRGSGKTVAMTSVSAELAKNDAWIVVELNPNRDMLQTLAAKIYSLPEMKKHFMDAKLDLTAFGIGISIGNNEKIFDIEIALSRMLEIVKNQNKKILVMVDEVVKNKAIRIFVSSFQMFIRNDYPIFLLMTGLYENIYNLQNDKSLTFLYRAPKTELEPLNYTAVRKSYKDTFNLTMEEAEKMTSLTKGYPFAYQVLGYIRWERKGATLESLMDEYDQYLDEFAYEKIWAELSPTEQKILAYIAHSGDNKVKGIREHLDMSSEKFAVYRDRMNKKSVVDVSRHGIMDFKLPRFDVFINNHSYT